MKKLKVTREQVKLGLQSIPIIRFAENDMAVSVL